NYGAVAIDADAVTQTECDVFAPCALGSVLTEDVANNLPARGVCGAANNIFANDTAADQMHRRGVVVVPDFIANIATNLKASDTVQLAIEFLI
ncbi:MAG TPA: leucine dehydrogenase, partial [Planctomycetes bacterium]|nr:leucine dehydrogenase [Planctomycetota bacterium]